MFCYAAKLGQGRRVIIMKLDHARVPGVTRIDLGENTTLAHFHLRPDEQGTALGYSDVRGNFVAIATFTDRAAAEAALGLVEKSMMEPRHSMLYRILQGITVLFAAGFLVMLVAGMLVAPASRAPVVMAPQPGAPMDADSRLAPPEE